MLRKAARYRMRRTTSLRTSWDGQQSVAGIIVLTSATWVSTSRLTISCLEQAAAAFIDQTYGHLDILVNNAAITVDERKSPPSQLAMADLQKVFATNFFGVFAVIGAMLPLLKRSQAGRIVNLSSKAGSLALASTSASGSFFDQIPPALAYTSSKTALNALTVAFARELRGTKIKINAVSPGYVATDLNDHSGLLTPEQGAHEPVAYATLPEDGPHGGFFGSEGAISW